MASNIDRAAPEPHRSAAATLAEFRRSFIESLFHWRSSDTLMIEQFRSLRLQVPGMHLAIVINIAFLAVASARDKGRDCVVVPALIAGLIAIRLVSLCRKRSRSSRRTIGEMRDSMTASLIFACVISAALTTWTAIIGHSGGKPNEYVALFTALSTICCTICLSSLPLAAYIVIAVGTVPISASLLMMGDPILASMGANILLIAPLIVGMIYRQHQQLRHMVASRTDIAAERAKVSDLAYRDPLTGLANRRVFLDELETASRARSGLAIAIIDLNGFKLINDTYGHRAGDALLVATARRFERLDLGNALIARMGGDEFAVLLRDVATVDDARQRLSQLDMVFKAMFDIGGQTFRLRASIGMAQDVSDTGTTLALIGRADLAMYEAKRTRRGTICQFEPAMEARIHRRLMIEQALATPAETERITLEYQPVFDSATGRIVAFEALARSTHPTLGVISPAEFIPLAEQSGMTMPMTTHLLSMALDAASTWPQHVGLSFNLSGAELNSPLLARQILEAVLARGFDPRRLSIEITETALLSDFATARGSLSSLQSGGVRILLDDFGAGYASIGYLREIRFDGVKLDGSLVAPLMHSPVAIDLLIGVLHLCQAIGAPVTAEMVETSGQYDLLCALGIPRLQGYFLSRPLTTSQAARACAAAPDPENCLAKEMHGANPAGRNSVLLH